MANKDTHPLPTPPYGARVAKTPTVLQLEAVECGAACLAIVLAYYGKHEPLATLRRACGVSRDGSKASNIVRAARQFGLEAKGFSKEIDDLPSIAAPYIVFWNFNHFVVVEGITKKGVHLNDPASGHRVVSHDEFERCFTGVVLVVKPGPDFERSGHPTRVATAISSRLRGTSAALSFCILAGFLLVLPGLALAGFNQIFLDHILLERRTDWLRPLMLGMLLTLAVQALLRFLQLRYLRRLKIFLSIKLSSRYMWHLLQLPATFYAQRFPGEVANRSRLNDKLAGVLSGKLAQTVIDVAMMIFYAVLMFYYDAVLTTVGVAVALMDVMLLRWISKRRIESNMRVLHEYGKAQGTSLSGLQSIETIKSAGLENQFFQKWAGYYTKGANARQDLELSNQGLTVLPRLLDTLAMTGILIIGGYRIINGHLSIGMLVAFQSLMRSFLLPIDNLVNLGSLLQELQGDLCRVDDVLEQPLEAKPPARPLETASGERIVRLKGHLELRDITFGYSPLEAPFIEGFHLVIRPGERVALVGRSGSGKTTITKLISGELTPWSGEVLFDEVPTASIPQDVRVNSFSIIEQDIFLFGDTVRNNLTLWDDTVPDKHLIHACEDAAIDDVVVALSGGYDGELLEGGVNLSGGQAQRLEIARALVNNPSILILDEATSALDAETEHVVLDKLRARGCTSLIVSHRLSTIRDCDEIIVMQGGRVVERGTHEVLWKADGEYAGLIRTENHLHTARPPE